MRAGLLVLTLFLLALLPGVAHSQGPVTIFITAPDVAGTGKTIDVNVTAAGGPAADNGTYRLTAWLRGPDLTGAAPLEDTPLTLSGENNTFGFNVTMPVSEQTVEVVVEINSTKGAAFEVETSSRPIQVLVPLRVTARVENRGSVAVQDVPVFLSIDGKRVQEQNISRLEPGASQVVEFEHLPVGLGVGAHTVEVHVDINKDGVIDPAIGEVALRTTFFKEGEPLNPLWIVVGIVAAVIGAAIVGAAIRRRRAGRA